MDDLKDLAENGLTDLFEYGQEFMVGGNALGDGSSKKNTTEEKKTETFQEKYRRELAKDLDDLGADDEEEEKDGEVAGLGEEDSAPGEKALNLDDLMNDEEDESTDAEGDAAEAQSETAKDL